MKEKNKKEELYNKIEELEQKKMAYLEVDNKAGANRIQNRIRQLENEIQLLNFNKLKAELSIYKETVKQYPGLMSEIKRKLIDKKIISSYNEY